MRPNLVKTLTGNLRMVVEMTQEEYTQLRDESCGVCLGCGSLAEGGVEPDAEGYECEDCGKEHVAGIENALLLGRVKFVK